MLSLIAPFAVAVFAIIINAIVNTNIKFAKDKESAYRSLKNVGARALNWAMTLLIIYALFHALRSKDPITRVDVFEIAGYVGTLLFNLVMQLQRQLWSELLDVLIKSDKALLRDMGSNKPSPTAE